MNKLQMAHEWVMKIIEGNVRAVDASDLLERAWKYADAMQAEADKREKQNKDEFYANLADPMKKVREQEWQPDWSQAPDGYDWWAMDGDYVASWFLNEPYINVNEWNTRGMDVNFKSSPLFNYQGDWRNSLRKRPQ